MQSRSAANPVHSKGGGTSKKAKKQNQAPIETSVTSKDQWVPPVAVGLFVLVLCVFFQTRNFGFLNFDDNQYIQEIPAVISGFNWQSVNWAWTHSHVGQWHPLTSMSFMIDSQMGGLKTGGIFHLNNVLEQALASVLLLFALRSLTGSLWRSAIAAAIFAIHPLRAESVAWVTERKDVLSGVFLMATLWAYSLYTQRPVQKGRYFWVCACFTIGLAMTVAMKMGHAPDTLIMALPWIIGLPLAFVHLGARYGLVVLLFALGLLSKPMLVTLPFVFLLLDVWPLKRFSWDKFPESGQEWLDFISTIRPFVSEKLPLLIMAFASAVGAMIAVGEPFRPIPILPLVPRLEYIPISYTRYIWQFFYPFNLSAHYPFVATGPEILPVVLCSVFLLGISVLTWVKRQRYPYFLVGWLWFLGTMLPVIGLVPGGIQIAADRYTYLTQIGLAVALVWAVGDWLEQGRLRISKPMLVLLVGSLITGLAVRAYQQAGVWQTDKSLWTHAIEVTKNNDYAFEKLATTLQSEGKAAEAEKLYRDAIALNPRLVGSLNNLSILLRARGQFAEATEFQQKAVNEHPKWALMHRNLGSALLQQNRPQEALASLKKASEIDPNDPDSSLNYCMILTDVLGGKENFDTAIAELKRITTRQPGFAEGMFALGNAYYRLNRMDEAAQAYQRTLAIAPNHGRAANNLGSILSNRGAIQEAITYYRRATASDGNYVDAYRNLADCLTRTGAFSEAITVWHQVLERKSDDLQGYLRLAWLLATCPDASLRSPTEARDLASKGMELSGGKEFAFFDVLAAAQAQQGNFPGAIETARKGIELAGATTPPAQAMQSRLNLYLEGKTFIDTTIPVAK